MSKTIMIVDDSLSMRQVLGKVLTDAGFQVTEAVDGSDAVKKLTATPDLLITDLNMPNMDGIQLIEKVRAMPSCKQIPILMLTTESDATKKQAGRAAGAAREAVSAGAAARHRAQGDPLTRLPSP